LDADYSFWWVIIARRFATIGQIGLIVKEKTLIKQVLAGIY